MDAQKILNILAVVAAVLAPYVALDQWGLILVLIGLIMGFMGPAADAAARASAVVTAALLPGVADSLDAIPAIGSHVNGIVDNLAVVVAGYAVASFIMMLVNRLK